MLLFQRFPSKKTLVILQILGKDDDLLAMEPNSENVFLPMVVLQLYEDRQQLVKAYSQVAYVAYNCLSMYHFHLRKNHWSSLERNLRVEETHQENIRFPRKQIPFVDTQAEVPSSAG